MAPPSAPTSNRRSPGTCAPVEVAGIAPGEFVDECTVHVRGGDGGNGAVAFRREAHVPRGGPAGGDGGRGGDVVFVADRNTTSLLDLHRHPHRRAERGGHGEGSNRHGANGADLVVRVPLGTVVRDRTSGEELADLAADHQRFVAARGGRGGRGNATFANRYQRAPGFAELGEPATERSLRLELKLIADVGLVGFPSAGKSSLIARLSAARPKVAAYPFTTLVPNLGVMRAGDVDVVIADVPGLIEGASEGRGLGHRFLRHVERCLVVVHVIDLVPMEPDRDPLGDLEVVRRELLRHDPALLERPQLVVLNKVDLPEGRALADEVLPELARRGERALAVSAVSGAGLDPLRYLIAEVVAAQRALHPADATVGEVVIRLDREDERPVIGRDDAGRYTVRGPRVERWVRMTQLDNREALRHLQGRLRRGGVERALVAAGARAGDEVEIAGHVFDFTPEVADLPTDEQAALLAGELDTEADVDAEDEFE